MRPTGYPSGAPRWPFSNSGDDNRYQIDGLRGRVVSIALSYKDPVSRGAEPGPVAQVVRAADS